MIKAQLQSLGGPMYKGPGLLPIPDEFCFPWFHPVSSSGAIGPARPILFRGPVGHRPGASCAPQAAETHAARAPPPAQGREGTIISKSCALGATVVC